MRSLLRLLLSLSITLSALPAAASNARRAATFQKQPDALKVQGLKRGVTVRRDSRGVPYIEAENEDDLYFTQGYVTASDRLWQMDLFRRTARGELSEILGKGALEEDKRRRVFGFGRVSEALVARATPRVRASLEAYARGVNAYVASLDDKSLPPEFQILQYRPRPWAPADSIAIGKNFAEALSTTWHLDIMRAAFARLPKEKRDALLPVTSPIDVPVVGSDTPKAKGGHTKGQADAAVFGHAETLRALAEISETTRRTLERVGLYAEDLAASNNWVVCGRHTASGKPLLANDPHLAPSAPPIWYLTHLSMPGLRVAGVTSPGAPGIILGHNEQIAWGATNLGPDVQDVYLEKFDKENPRRYMTPQGWREADIRREEIKVRKDPKSPETETVMHEVTVTRNGPVIFERDGARYALRWTALDETAVDFEGFYFINRARNWKEFTESLKTYKGPTQNFIYADTAGHIGYYGAGLIPLRKSGDGSVPYDGSTGEGEWTGRIPFAELPHVFDPPSGIIVTANSRVVGASYPHHLTHNWASPARARRILDMLSAKRKLTADDFRAIQADAHSISGVVFAREVAEVAHEAGMAERDEKWRETAKLFEGWDGELAPDSRAARLAAEMRARFQRKILEGALGPALAGEYRWGNGATFFDRLIEERPREWLPEGTEGYAQLLDAVHREARESLSKRLGADESRWTWGAEAVVRFPHPLAAADGPGRQFAVAPFPQTGGGGFFASPNVGSAVSMRLIADISDWDKTQQGTTLGQSGDPRSPHWQDQLDEWRASTPGVFPFTPRAVGVATKVVLRLEPAAR